ncbi:MAG: superoxide dismutase [Proteobacteria bacterium]|nr:superoxide dismutase [Pseudomonadota bacterium]
MFALLQYPLNFVRDGLEPFMSAQTIDFHYGKHMDGYIKNLNGLIAGTDYENLPLEEIIKKAAAAGAPAQKIFNNAAQVFNHDFFFRGLSLDLHAEFPKKIADAFGSWDKFLADFKAAATGVFGSGWAWLVRDTSPQGGAGAGESGALKIETTANGDTPIAHGRKPIMCLDVWEHAYYLDYQNRRADFVDAFLTHLVNWDFVAANLK